MSVTKEMMRRLVGVKGTDRVKCKDCTYAYLPRNYKKLEGINNKCKYRPHRWLDSKMVRSCKEFLPCSIQKENT